MKVLMGLEMNIFKWAGNINNKRSKDMNRKNKAGFTLVELMVVAIIVAILAAVAIPLMMGNKDRAIATEAQAALGTVRTALQVYKAEHDVYPTCSAVQPNTVLSTIRVGDLKGKYFADTDYTLTSNISNYTATASGTTAGLATNITLNQDGDWTGIP